jgi:N-sulfoglucosamine sulfohydrolase-like protein
VSGFFQCEHGHHDFQMKTGLLAIVIYTSDQGVFLGDHNWFDKRFMYEESQRMPFLIRSPGKIKPGSVNDRMILNVDFASTFLEYAGLSIPPDIQGRSIAPLLRGEKPRDWERPKRIEECLCRSGLHGHRPETQNRVISVEAGTERRRPICEWCPGMNRARLYSP